MQDPTENTRVSRAWMRVWDAKLRVVGLIQDSGCARDNEKPYIDCWRWHWVERQLDKLRHWHPSHWIAVQDLSKTQSSVEDSRNWIAEKGAGLESDKMNVNLRSGNLSYTPCQFNDSLVLKVDDADSPVVLAGRGLYT